MTSTTGTRVASSRRVGKVAGHRAATTAQQQVPEQRHHRIEHSPLHSSATSAEHMIEGQLSSEQHRPRGRVVTDPHEVEEIHARVTGYSAQWGEGQVPGAWVQSLHERGGQVLRAIGTHVVSALREVNYRSAL
jgi:hypothetical protein